MQDKILANAQMVTSIANEMLDTPVGFDEAGVLWLDEYIENIRDTTRPETKALLPNTFGAFLGECVRQTYGGQWVHHEETGTWGIAITEKVTVFPFTKVAKHLDGKDGDSVYGFFVAIPAMLSYSTQGVAAAKKPWWKFREE